ncbi:hypothetical protein GCM10007362_04730 [Saccharibacillus endophyticus]|uniref:Uncharacterized protein n=1 Tax=Saccharibacillus endophyticus TaxID=2060666 RepID=A0ABQ1ZMV8_9BACL|nr:hypothetical protein GCM10007362_04730 [Saccharibacillus endophyticus]
MKIEQLILACIQEKPGISAEKIVACLNEIQSDLQIDVNGNFRILVYRQLRTLKKRRNVHNKGDRWYRINPNK